MPDRPDLTALIGSRICHDLISPIGAIGNGVELLMMDGAARGPEIALIAESVANANARIRFFRVAFGSATRDQRIGRSEVAGIIEDTTRGGRMVIDWQSTQDLSRREAKLAFLAIQCCETAMPYGGRIRVDQGDPRWTLVATAARMRLDTAIWEVLTNPAAASELTPAHVHFALLPEECARQGRRLSVELKDSEIRITF